MQALELSKSTNGQARPSATSATGNDGRIRRGVADNRTAAPDFDFGKATSRPIAELGDDAYWRDGHLYVLVGTIQMDVLVSGGDEAQNIAEAKKIAAALLPKIREFA